METEQKSNFDLLIPGVVITLLITILTSLLYTLIHLAHTLDLSEEWIGSLDFLAKLVLYAWFISSYLSVILLLISRYWEQNKKFQLILMASLALSLLVPVYLVADLSNIFQNIFVFPQIIILLIINIRGLINNRI